MDGMTITGGTDATSGDTVKAQLTAPTPMLQGSFALYEHNGGYLVAWKKRGETETRRLPIPAFVITMAAQASGRTPQQVIDELIGASS